MNNLKKNVSSIWIAGILSIPALLFWCGFLIAKVEGHKGGISALPQPFGAATLTAIWVSPFITILCGIVILRQRTSPSVLVSTSFFIGLSPTVYAAFDYFR